MLESSASGQMLVRYGYLAILAGAMLEGETVVLVAGFLAHQGYLSLPWIVIFAVIGSCASDQGLFFLSRVKGAKFFARFPRVAGKAQRMAERMRSRTGALTAFALLFRFFYGVRNVAPVFLGMSGIATRRFVVLNAVGAVLWAVSFSSLGYLFAQTLEAVMGTLARYEVILALLLIAGGGAWAAWRRWKKSRENPAPSGAPAKTPAKGGPAGAEDESAPNTPQ